MSAAPGLCYSAAAAQTFRRMAEASELVAGDAGVRLQSHRLLDMCLVIGVRPQGLTQLLQDLHSDGSEASNVSPEILSIHAPPFISSPANPEAFANKLEENSATSLPSGQLFGNTELPKEQLGIPRGMDLCGLPELCFPADLTCPAPPLPSVLHQVFGRRRDQSELGTETGPSDQLDHADQDSRLNGFKLDTEGKADSFHFLVLTDILGNREQGVVLQVHREIKESDLHPVDRLDSADPLRVPYAICVITRFPYYTALKDCLSCLLPELTACSQPQFEKTVNEFAAQLALVPCPPPGSLQLSFELGPLDIVLSPPEDVDSPVIDISLHLPFLCFTPETVLQILTNILTERRLVFLSSRWPLLTLVTQSFLHFLQPLRWRHPYIPVLASQMLDLVMAPTVFLMGCHSRHMDTISEVEELVLVDIDNGRILTTLYKEVETPPLPTAITEQFLTSVQQLQVNSELALSHLASCTSLASARKREQLHRHQLNQQIQHIFLQLIGSLLRDVPKHLNPKHHVFIKKEFLDTRQPAAQPFYVSLLKTDLFHCFLKARLNQKVDAFSRWELMTRSDRVNSEAATLPRSSNTFTSNPLRKRRDQVQGSSLQRMQDMNLSESLIPPSPCKPNRTSGATAKDRLVPRTLQLPSLPSDPFDSLSVSLYYTKLIVQITKDIDQAGSEDTETLAVCLYLRGIVRLAQGESLQALLDFQNLEKINMNFFPLELVKETLESMSPQQLRCVQETEELKGLLHDIMEKHWDRAQPEHSIKDFELPNIPLNKKDFGVHIQAAGLVSNPKTTDCLFDVLAGGQQKLVDPKTFNNLYSYWKKMKSELESITLDPEVARSLLENEQVSLVSHVVKTSCGLGRLALSQKRLFLLTEEQPRCKEIARLRDIEEVESSTPLKLPSLKVRVRDKKESFVAFLKTERDLWKVIIREVCAGKVLAERHKDPQYDQQALSNIQLIYAVAKCDHPRPTHAIRGLSQLDQAVCQVLPTVPKMTSDALKHTLHLSDANSTHCTVSVLLYVPGSLDPGESADSHPKLWCALTDGRVLMYDAASWVMEQPPIQAGRSRLNCMIGVGQDQVWLGSEDSFIYIISAQDLSCYRRLLAHHNQVSGMVQEEQPEDEGGASPVYSCSLDGTIVVWDPVTMEMKRQFQLQQCWQLSSIALHRGRIWCCVENSLVVLARDGTQLQRVFDTISPDGGSIPLSYFLILPQQRELWMLCTQRSSLYVCSTDTLSGPVRTISLPASSHLICMIHVKKQVWVGGGTVDGTKGRIYIVGTESHLLEKELEAPCGPVRALCSAEDRYVLSGTEDSKAIIWKVD